MPAFLIRRTQAAAPRPSPRPDLPADQRRRRGHQADAADEEQGLEHVDDLRRGQGVVGDLLEDDVVEERARGPEQLGDAERQREHDQGTGDPPPRGIPGRRLPPDDPVDAEHLHREDPGLERRRDQRGEAGAGDAELRERPGARDEQVGQGGVEADRGHGRDHRAARTAGRAEHAAEERADDGRHDGEPGEAEVAAARSGDGLGRADQPHQGLTPDEDRNGREDADATGEEQRGRDGLVEAGLVATAIGAGDEDAHRRADGAEGEDEDHRQAVGEADRRDGGGAERADDDLVDDVEEEGEDELRTHRNGDAGDLTTRGRRGKAGRLGVGGQGELSGNWLNFGTGGCARLRQKSCPGMPDGPGSRPRPAGPSYGEVGCGLKPVGGAFGHHRTTRSAGPLPCGRPRRCGGCLSGSGGLRAQKAPTPSGVPRPVGPSHPVLAMHHSSTQARAVPMGLHGRGEELGPSWR